MCCATRTGKAEIGRFEREIGRGASLFQAACDTDQSWSISKFAIIVFATGQRCGLIGGIMASDLNWELRLGFLLHDVSRLRRRVVDRALKPLGLTRSQWWVLAFLSRSDGMSQVALADELDLGKVALGQLVDRLEKTSFIFRRPDED